MVLRNGNNLCTLDFWKLKVWNLHCLYRRVQVQYTEYYRNATVISLQTILSIFFLSTCTHQIHVYTCIITCYIYNVF